MIKKGITSSFKLVNVHFSSSDIPSATAFWDNISQFSRHLGVCVGGVGGGYSFYADIIAAHWSLWRKGYAIG